MNIDSNELLIPELVRIIRAHKYDRDMPIIGALCDRVMGMYDDVKSVNSRIPYLFENLTAVKSDYDLLTKESKKELGQCEDRLETISSILEEYK